MRGAGLHFSLGEDTLKLSSGLALLGLGVLGVAIACVGSSTPPPAASDITCKGYCDQIMAKCLENDQGTNNLVFKDNATCLGMCQNIPLGTVKDNADTIGCRLANLSNVDDPHTPQERHSFCLEAAAFGCNSPCEAFCTLDAKVCPGTLFPYKDHADCLAQCKTYDPTFTGPFVGATGNNLQCRDYHMENAVVSPAAQQTHCPHTGVGQLGFGTALCHSAVNDAGPDSAASDASPE